MDYFYFFIAKGLYLLAEGGILSFVTTNYWLTASGAQKKLRPFLKREANFLSFINFGEYKIFQSAQGQHNCVFVIEKSRANKSKACDVIQVKKFKVLNPSPIFQILDWTIDLEGIQRFQSQPQSELYDSTTHNITFLNPVVNDLIKKLIRVRNFYLGELCDISGGVSSSADRVTNANFKHCDDRTVEKYNISIGDGILVLDKKQLNKLRLHKDELRYVKPYFKSTDIHRYVTNEEAEKYLVYATHVNAPEIEQLPNLYEHLRRYKCILKNRSQDIELERAMTKGHWFVLTNGRPKIDFSSEKIICPYRSKTNIFGFNKLDWYAGRDVYYLLNFRCDPRFLLGLLNSSLILFWLKNKGKRK